MTDSSGRTHRRERCLEDARGRRVTQLDPVRAHLLNQRTLIPVETLQVMVDDLLPGAKKKRLIQVLAVVFGFLFVICGNIIYFRYFSTWKGLDPVNAAIYAVQLVVLLGGPVVAFRLARQEYAHRVADAMMRRRHCPHCGYDLRGLPTAPGDGATVCPECGCAWQLRVDAR